MLNYTNLHAFCTNQNALYILIHNKLEQKLKQGLGCIFVGYRMYIWLSFNY